MLQFNTNIFIDLLTAALLGALIGFERELAGKDPSLRTFSLICLGSCMFSIISAHTSQGINVADPTRIAAQVVSGIGFLGAGAIFRSHNGVTGLTTAALMWVTAAIGMCVGFGRQDVAITGTFIALGIIMFFRFIHIILKKLRIENVKNKNENTRPRAVE
jgi:putative Mg2+ transporter-C (MgtC) family protein